jgi:hypothetical protein
LGLDIEDLEELEEDGNQSIDQSINICDKIGLKRPLKEKFNFK